MYKSKNTDGLKPGWRRVKFGDVVRQSKEKAAPETSGLDRYIAGDHMDTDDLRLRRWGEIGSGYLGPAFHIRFRPGQVLYGSRRTYLRKVAIADFEGICANTTFVLESNDGKVLLPEYLPFLMQTDAFNAYSVKNSKGSVNPYINFSDLTKFEFALPSITEQVRIVKLLLAIQEQTREIEDCLFAANMLYKSVIEVTYCASNDMVSRLTDMAKINPDQLSTKEVSEDRVISYIDIGTISEPKVIDEIAEINLRNASSRARRKVQDGDLIISTVRPNLKSFARITHEHAGAIVSTGFAVVRANMDFERSFIFHGFFSSHFDKFCVSKNEGTSYPAIKSGDLAEFTYPRYSLERRREIGDRLDVLERTILRIKERLKASQNLAVTWRNTLMELRNVI